MHRLFADLSAEEFILGSIESNSPRERRSEVDFLLRFIIGDLSDGAGNVLARSYVYRYYSRHQITKFLTKHLDRVELLKFVVDFKWKTAVAFVKQVSSIAIFSSCRDFWSQLSPLASIQQRSLQHYLQRFQCCCNIAGMLQYCCNIVGMICAGVFL